MRFEVIEEEMEYLWGLEWKDFVYRGGGDRGCEETCYEMREEVQERASINWEKRLKKYLQFTDEEKCIYLLPKYIS